MILQLCSYLSANAFHTRCFEAIASRNIQQTVICPHNVDDRFKPVHELVSLKNGNQSGWSTSRRIFYSLKVRDYEQHIRQLVDFEYVKLIHAHSLFADGLTAHRVAKKYSKPLIVTIRGGDISVFPKYYPHWKSRAREVLEYSEKIVFVNNNYIASLESALGIKLPREKCAVIPNAADDDWHCEQVVARKSHKIRKIVCVGKLIPRKNQLGLIRAVEMAREETKENITLDIIGAPSGKYGQKVLSLCQEHEWLRYRGTMNQAQLIPVFKEYDLFALASHDENFGIVYAEALASGIPILYSKNQGFDGWSDSLEYGIAVDSRNCQSILNAINKFHESWESSPAAYQAFSSDLFRWSVIAEQHEMLYKPYS